MSSRQLAGRAIAAIAAAALTASPAVAATIQTYSQSFSVKRPGTSTGMKFLASAKDPSAPLGAPVPARKLTLTFPAGTRINTATLARCRNAASCPDKSRLGAGKAVVILLGDRYTLPVTAYNRAGGMVLNVVNPLGSEIVLEPVLSRNALSISLPNLSVMSRPIVLSELALVIRPHGSGSTAYATTPKACSSSHAWTFKARFDYADGATKMLTSKSACVSSAGVSSPARAGARARIRPQLKARPAVLPAGARLTLIGSGFRPGERVWLGVGPPQSEAQYWGSDRTNRAGAFRRTFIVNRRVPPGRWVAIACQRGCRIKAGAGFRTVAGRG